MSADALPIDPVAFASALTSLPPETLHHKAAEIRNSIAHLKSSNEQMLPFADEGDVDCREAMFENLVVIGRMNERVAMIREEVEKRGLRWSEAEVEDAQTADTAKSLTNGHMEQPMDEAVTHGTQQGRGRLSDEEIRRRLEEQMGPDDDEEGVHL